MSRILHEYLQRAHQLADDGVLFVTVTLVSPEGHVPQDIGARAIITESGLAWGTVGGGRLEAAAILHATKMMSAACAGQLRNQPVAPQCVRYELLKDLNMVCGGAATLFYEVSGGHAWSIAIFGAGHVAQATAALLSTFHCNLLCIDPRAEWLARMPTKSNLRTVLAETPADYVESLPAGSFCLCMSQGHSTDLPIVRKILAWNKAAFLGVIGSEPKARQLRSTLLKDGVSEDQLASIHCPLGLPIGSNAPAEIAVSIAAQLLQVRDTLAHGSPPATPITSQPSTP